MPELWLDPISVGSIDRVADITVAPNQEKFAGTIAEAFECAEEGVDFHGIFLGKLAVGFFKIDRLYADRYPFADPNDVGLRAFMIDLSQQGQGIATRAVTALPGYIRQKYPDAEAVVLSVNKANPAAVRAYINGGFQDTGKEWPHGDAGPQYVLRLPVLQPSKSVMRPIT